MNELLMKLTLLGSLGVAALALLRPILRQAGGAPALYLSWLALPLVLLSPWLPRTRSADLAPEFLVSIGTLASTETPAAIMAASAPDAPWLLLWAAGALLLATGLGWQQWRFLRQRRGHRLPAGMSPVWLGLWRGRLYLPRDFRARFDARERRLILAHERVHARRKDNLWTLLATLLWLLNWFNPLAWWALRRFRGDQELAADAQVLRRHPGELGPYLRALAKAQPGLEPLGAGAPLASPFSPHPLIERIRLMKSPAARIARPWVALLASLLLAGVSYAVTPARKSVATEDARYVVQTLLEGKEVDRAALVFDKARSATKRLKGFAADDLLLTLQAKQATPEGEALSMTVRLGLPANTTLTSDLALEPGQQRSFFVQQGTKDPRQLEIILKRLGKAVHHEPVPAVAAEVEIKALIDGQPIGRSVQRTEGQASLPLNFGEPTQVKGELLVRPLYSGRFDLQFELDTGGRRSKPRVITADGKTAVIEFNASDDPRLIRLEVTATRTVP